MTIALSPIRVMRGQGNGGAGGPQQPKGGAGKAKSAGKGVGKYGAQGGGGEQSADVHGNYHTAPSGGTLS